MKTIILLCTLFLTACSSVPLTTMMHFSDTKPEDFFTVDPKGILVKVSINSMVNFDPARSLNLSISIEDSSGQRNMGFPLEVVNKTTQAAVKGIFKNRPGVDVYILKLAPRALTNLKLLHQESKSGIKKRVGLTAGVNFSKEADDDLGIDENTVLSVALKLTKQGEFITLIDQLKVGVGVAPN